MMADPSNDGEPDTMPDAAATLGDWLLRQIKTLDEPGVYPLTLMVAPNGQRRLVGAGGRVIDIPEKSREACTAN